MSEIGWEVPYLSYVHSYCSRERPKHLKCEKHSGFSKDWFFVKFDQKLILRPECIPVGCVPPVAVPGSPHNPLPLGVDLETAPARSPSTSPLGVGLETPLARSPSTSTLGVGLETPWPDPPQLPPWVWTWRPPWPDPPQLPSWVWTWRSPLPDPPKLPLGCGPGNLQGMLGYHPPVNRMTDRQV